MENTGRQKFDDQWRSAFEGQEMEPSESVWNNIDLKLDNDKMKRRVLFYQRLAAASIVFALLVGVVTTQYLSNDRLDLAVKQGPAKEEDLQNNQTDEVTVKDTSKKEEVEESATDVNEELTETKAKNANVVAMETDGVADNTTTTDNVGKGAKQFGTTTSNSAQSSTAETMAGFSSQNPDGGERQESQRSGGHKASVLTADGQSKVSQKTNEEEHHVAMTVDKAAPDVTKQSAVNLNSATWSQWSQQGNSARSGGLNTSFTNSNGNTKPQSTSIKGSSREIRNGSKLMDNSAFTRMTAWLAPQLKNNDLPEGVGEIKEERRVLPEMPAYLMASASSSKKTNERTWLAFGAAAGSYNPGNNASAANARVGQYAQYGSTSFANQSAPQSNTRSSQGSAYSVGLSIGKKISERWLVQSGVNYMNQAISYTSNYASYTTTNEQTAFVADYASKTSAPLAITKPYKVNSSMEFISVPVQAGYMIINREFGLQWNAGVATDVFLRNTLKDQSGQSSKYSQGSGEESPYRSINMAALTSTELSYKLGHQYRVSLVPGVRYSFHSILKSESGSGNKPLILDIGFRFRYIFQ